MRWQRAARFALAAFTLVFAGFVAQALRRPPAPAAVPESLPLDDAAVVQTLGKAEYKSYDKAGKIRIVIRSEGQRVYDNGRNVLEKATVELPDRDGRTVTITADEAEVTRPPDGSSELSTAIVRRNVRMTTSDDLTMTANEATYNEGEGMLTIPGPVTFTRGRLTGQGVGATYDRGRDVVWLLADAKIDVAPDATGGGRVHGTAGTAGLARADHYLRMSKAAHLESDGRVIDAEDLVIRLTDDDQKVTAMELRGNSRVVGTGANAQSMSATNIDLAFGPDGRALQQAHLMEQSVLQLPSPAGTKRITARNIDVTMAPDGATVTQLNARESVVLDLPGDKESPARRITSSQLTASGDGTAGLQNATFEGPVDFRETSPAARGQTPATRHAVSRRLIVRTQPGLGAIDQADFRGNVKFTDGASTTAEAPRADYRIADDRLDLASSNEDPGPAPTVSNGRITVFAKTISMTVGSQALKADTDVRSRLERQDKAGSDGSKLPSMLSDDQPVTVTSNRLEYDGQASRAVFRGNARLTQDRTEIKGDTIDLDDRTGNLTATTNVTTRMAMQDTDPKTKQTTTAETNGQGETFEYNDEKRIAVYTSSPTVRAQLRRPQDNVTGDRIELFLKEGARELQRVEADGNVVTVESNRTAKGKHLTYTESDQTYVMTGTPVDVLQRETPNCKRTLASTLRFRRAVDNIETEGNPVTTATVACPAAS